MKYKIQKQRYEHSCSDGCCFESGYKWFIDGKLVHSSPCEDSGMLAILKSLGIDAEITFLDESGEEICSL